MNKKYKDIVVGEKYPNTHLTIISIGKTVGKRQFYNCKCDCGIEKEISGHSIKYGRTKSCGCQLCKTKNTLYGWCVEHKRMDLIDLWDTAMNSKDMGVVPFQTHTRYYFKCPRGLHESSFPYLPTLTKNNSKETYCKKCNSIAQKLLDIHGPDAISKYWDSDKNKVDPWEVSRCSPQHIWVKCQDVGYHGSYDVSCDCFSKGKRCPYCAGQRVNYFDSLGHKYPFVIDIWGNKNLKTPHEYLCGSDKKIILCCEKGRHNDYRKKVYNAIRDDFRCPECVCENNESSYQKKVRAYINSVLRYKTLHEWLCSIVPQHPKNKRRLPFDNEIPELRLVVEVHGKAHYRIDNITKRSAARNNISPELEFHKRRLYDRYKKYISYVNGYHYLEIPFWTVDDGSYKSLIDSKISYILKHTNVA